MSIDLEKRIYVCKHCGGEITDKDRRLGKWKAKYKNKKYSGYWISLLMAPWISAGDIIDKWNDPMVTKDFFYNKVLGLPYVGAGNKVTKEHVMQNVTVKVIQPLESERMIIGVDTGTKLDYVCGSDKGLFFHGDTTDYNELDKLMIRWSKAICVMDAGGDLIGSRKFRERWKNRVFLATYTSKKGTDKPTWNDDEGTVTIDPDKMIQWCADELRDRRIQLQGSESDWYEYWLDWNNMSRTDVYDPTTNQFKGHKWVRNGRNHRVSATTFWRVGVDRFTGNSVTFFSAKSNDIVGEQGMEILPDGTTKAPNFF